MQSFLKYIQSIANISDTSWQFLLPALSTTKLKKGEFLLKENQVCNALFFIETGFCRSFYNKEGEEKNTSFHFENEVVTNINSFGTGEKSAYNIQTCEPTSLIIVDKLKLIEASKHAPEIETVGKKCLRLTASKLEEHSSLFKLYSPQERYEYLESNHPQILQRVSLTQLSSYLGMARETLSRIRSRRTN
ncbi:MAG: Crp/Fnr family transcriptional regulator [Thalassobius sp.]|nr:Crp/Fnr family transcriptional regulator [Thalassovita sp.]